MPASKKTEGGESWYLSDLSPDDKPWDIHRAQSDEIAKIYDSVGYDGYAKRIGECAQLLTYALKATDDGEVKLKLREARFCRVRHCLVCQWRRSLMWRARFFKALPEIQAKYPTGRWIFLTLTVSNCELSELRQTLTWMNAAWQRLIQRKVFPALGFVKSVEVTRSPDGTAHPHFHCLMLVPASYFSHKYISQSEWANLWQSCLKTDYTPIVDIRSVKPKKTSLNAKPDPLNKAMAQAVCETLKYSVKPGDLLADPKWLDELTKQLQKTRAISIGGCLKEFFSEDDPEDLINGEIEEDEKSEDESLLLFDWSVIVRRYKKTNGKKS
jgi:Plasmid rolling circle replication initiator protein and truncated derivatives